MTAISASELSELSGFAPDWPAPAAVRAFCAHRHVDSAQLTGDYRQADDRALLQSRLGIAPFWLKQTHSIDCINISQNNAMASVLNPEADASYFCAEAEQIATACVVLTADCLPILLCSHNGQEIAAVHAGWRGLAAGVIESALTQFRAPAGEIMAWLGPAISVNAFEVGAEVRDAFLAAQPTQFETIGAAFHASAKSEHFFADLYQLARLRLQSYGVQHIYGGHFCTVAEPRLHSYRRDGAGSGRMATLIWLERPLRC